MAIKPSQDPLLEVFNFVRKIKQAYIYNREENLLAFNKFENRLNVLCECFSNILPEEKVFYRARIAGHVVNGIPRDSDREVTYMLARPNSCQFRGFDANGSREPTATSNKRGGRTNKSFTSHLYLSETEEVTIAEVRPIINTYISVAAFRNLRSRKILDLSTDLHDSTSDATKLQLFRYFLSLEFGWPLYEDIDYVFTQYISECITNLGYDGIKYSSAAYPGGVNYSMFALDNWEAVSSDLVQVVENKYTYQTAALPEDVRLFMQQAIGHIESLP